VGEGYLLTSVVGERCVCVRDYVQDVTATEEFQVKRLSSFPFFVFDFILFFIYIASNSLFNLDLHITSPPLSLVSNPV
jgi:hypothetical protein